MGKYVGEPNVGEPDGGKLALGEPVVGKQNRRWDQAACMKEPGAQ
jgi:hypothetical protein